MNKREWFIFWAGTSVAGAIFGAILHSPGIVAWNMALLGWDIYMVQRAPR